MQRLATSFVLAYHGCDRAVAERLIGGEPFKPSTNGWDWLGEGVYFWEGDPVRALEWAHLLNKRLKKNGKAIDPEVVGVVLDLGLCLNLATRSSLMMLESAYAALSELAVKAGVALPKNEDFLRRQLDCAVLNYFYSEMPEPKFQTVRGVFPEGKPIYPGSLVQDKTHTQIAVRDLSCIKGVFRVPADQLA